MQADNRSNSRQVILAYLLHEILSYYMHTHILINKELGINLTIFSTEEEIDLVAVLDEIITERLCHATEGIQET